MVDIIKCEEFGCGVFTNIEYVDTWGQSRMLCPTHGERWRRPAPVPATPTPATAEVLVQFTVPGKPIPKKRPIVNTKRGKRQAFTPPETQEYEDLVRSCAVAAYGNRAPSSAKVVLSCVFYGAHGSADADNLFKSISDAIESGAKKKRRDAVLVNDSQVVEGHFYKKPKDEHGPRTEVLVTIYRPEET